MKQNTTIARKLLAGTLLVVFLFISIVKLFHTHETNGTAYPSSHIEQVAKDTDCSVCDYHFTKDSDFRSEIFAAEIPAKSSSSSVFYQGRTTSSIGLRYSDRGPPAQA